MDNIRINIYSIVDQNMLYADHLDVLNSHQKALLG